MYDNCLSAIESSDNLSDVKYQRENLLELNQDLVFWVYELVNEWEDVIETRLIENALLCYPNQLENLKWLKANNDVNILDLKEYMSWKIVFLKKTNNELDLDEEKICYVWVWVLELIKSRWKNKKLHHSVTQRDSWANDIWLYTPVSWRWIWKNIDQESAREYIEERSIFWSNWKLYIPNLDILWLNSSESLKIAHIALVSFFTNKLWTLSTYKTTFEKRFWMSIEEFYKKLEYFIYNLDESFLEFYEVEDITSKVNKKLAWTQLWKNIKNIIVSWEDSWKFHVVFDERTGWYECKKIIYSDIVHERWIPLGQLFTESSNQKPKFVNSAQVVNKPDLFVPYFVEFVEQIKWVEEDVLWILEK